MPRALWKGAITFGLVHIPVALYPAARERSVDFDWLDRKTMKPVGYKRINKATGREVNKEDIVKGVEVEGGEYVVLTDEEIRAANPERTQTVEILAFVQGQDIAPVFFDRPYVLAPSGRGAEKVYLLLREALKKSGRVGVAQVVIQTKQHLAALMPQGDALLLNTLRWHDELRSMDDMALPGSAKGKLAPSAAELRMAEQLIADMSADWKPEDYADHTHDEIMAMVKQKQSKGEIQHVEPVPAAGEGGGAQVIDLTELLKRSLKGPGGKTAKTVPRSAPARKRSAKAASKPAAKAARKRA